jgi:ribonuclease BN (tRNA processing enzyme)
MEIVFLGTGGGRINLIKQIRATAGFRINSVPANIHVDPGPGALLHSLKNKEDPLSLDGIIATHNHIDHVSDAMVLVEAMTGYGLKKRGVFIGSRYVIDGNDEGKDQGIHAYHKSKVEHLYSAVWGEKKTFDAGKGPFPVEIFKMHHDEPSAFGFKLGIEGKIIGYITDTEYMESLGKDFAGCDLLIINCIKPEGDKYVGHLKTGDVVEILKAAKPKRCVITHLGLKMLRIGPGNEAQKIQEASGVETIAARDGMRLNI